MRAVAQESSGPPESRALLVPKEDTLLALFDQHVANGSVFFDNSQRLLFFEVDGWRMEFRITKAYNNKPLLAPNAVEPSETSPKFEPGSDINVRGLEITQLGETHRLTFNMYCPYRPHYLLLTLDGFRRQWEALDIDDFRAAHAVLTAFDSEYVIFYNCQENGGCSRLHKHMQAIPKETFDPWCNLDSNGAGVPFQYYSSNHTDGLPGPEELLETYRNFLHKARELLKQPCTKPNEAPAHNIILDRRGLIVIPRRSAGIDDVGANACGMLGMIWLPGEDRLQRWLSIGPKALLEAAGVPRGAQME